MIEFKFIGWCNEDGHDKVWAVAELCHNINNAPHFHNPINQYVAIWGKRGKKLKTNIMASYDADIDTLIRSKLRKDYKRIDEAALNTVYPEFEKDLSKTAFWSTFKL